MSALIYTLPAMIIGGLLALAGVLLGSRITARAMGGWFSPSVSSADDLLDEAGGDTGYKPSVVQSIRDKGRSAGLGEEEIYPVESYSEEAPPFILPVGEPTD